MTTNSVVIIAVLTFIINFANAQDKQAPRANENSFLSSEFNFDYPESNKFSSNKYSNRPISYNFSKNKYSYNYNRKKSNTDTIVHPSERTTTEKTSYSDAYESHSPQGLIIQQGHKQRLVHQRQQHQSQQRPTPQNQRGHQRNPAYQNQQGELTNQNQQTSHWQQDSQNYQTTRKHTGFQWPQNNQGQQSIPWQQNQQGDSQHQNVQSQQNQQVLNYEPSSQWQNQQGTNNQQGTQRPLQNTQWQHNQQVQQGQSFQWPDNQAEQNSQQSNQGHQNENNNHGLQWQFANQGQQNNHQSNQVNNQAGFIFQGHGGGSKSEQKCNEYSKVLTQTVQAIPLVTNAQGTTITVEKCEHNSVPLIVGGKPAAAGEFPFMAAVGFYVDDRIDWKCGGTLISDRYVVTAAHCTFSRDGGGPKLVRLGDLDLTRNDDGSVHADYEIDSPIVHPEYRYPKKYNDIALLRTRRKVRFTRFIRPACLYTKPYVDAGGAIATGYGKTDFIATETSNKLMKVSLDIFNKSVCEQTYTENKYMPQGVISNMLCAGNLSGGKDTCQGDSGGPLIITERENHCKFYIIGITSFGRGCAAKNVPAIYTKISSFIPWLEQMVWP